MRGNICLKFSKKVFHEKFLSKSLQESLIAESIPPGSVIVFQNGLAGLYVGGISNDYTGNWNKRQKCFWIGKIFCRKWRSSFIFFQEWLYTPPFIKNCAQFTMYFFIRLVQGLHAVRQGYRGSLCAMYLFHKRIWSLSCLNKPPFKNWMSVLSRL